MKQFFFIEDSITNRISFYHLVLFLATLPFDLFYSQLVMISFALHTMIHCKRQRFRLLISKPVLLIISIYVLGLIGILYSPDRTEALNVAGRQSAIFFMPILLTLNGLDLAKYKERLLGVFAVTCTIVVLYLYADAIRTILYFQLPLTTLFSQAFINHNFSLPIGIHATYLSMYVALSIVFFLYLLLQNGWRLLYAICICILLAGLMQLSSRAAVIALLLVINFIFPFFIPAGKSRIRFIIVAALLSCAVLFTVISIVSFKLRYVAELKKDLTQSSINNEMMEPRAARWQIVLGLVKLAPLTGYGSGSEKELLKEKYFEKKLYVSYLEQFNAHSQYLSFLLKTGVIGLALYCYVMFVGFSVALKKRDLLFGGFMVLIAVVSVSENILDVNKGVFFYSFFMSFFLLANSPEIFYRRQPG